jgi:hypothetical protein
LSACADTNLVEGNVGNAATGMKDCRPEGASAWHASDAIG